MENNRIAKYVYIRDCARSRSAGRVRKRWIDTVKDMLKEKSVGCQATRRVVHDRSECRGFLGGSAWGVARGINP